MVNDPWTIVTDVVVFWKAIKVSPMPNGNYDCQRASERLKLKLPGVEGLGNNALQTVQ
jgi:hypothetical protein